MYAKRSAIVFVLASMIFVSCSHWRGKTDSGSARSADFTFKGQWPLDDVSGFTGRARQGVIWANALWYTKRYDEAASSLEKIVDALKPKTVAYERVVLALGMIYEKVGDWEKARLWYSHSLTDGLGKGETRFKKMMSLVLSMRACLDARDGCSPEPFAALCKEGNLNACHDEGVAYVYLGKDNDALKAFESACKKGERESCAQMSWLRFNSQGVEGNIEENLELRCNEGVPLACAMLAHLYRMREPSCTKVTVFLARRACVTGEWLGCYELHACGVSTSEDDLKHSLANACRGWDAWSPFACLKRGELEVPSSKGYEYYGRALILMRRQCQGGAGRACEGVARMYRQGKGVLANESKSLEYSEKSCNYGYLPGCVSLWAVNYESNPSKALQIFKSACDKGVGRACGLYASKKKRISRADLMKILRKGCSSFDGVSCRLLAEQIATKSGWSKAASLLRKGCALGDAVSCEKLGTMYATGKGVVWDPRKAFKMYEQACSRGNYMACTKVADTYTVGSIVRQSYEKAATLYREACDNNIGSACNSLGEFHLLGSGVEADSRKALSFFDKACRLGTPMGCFNLGNLYLKGMGVERDTLVAAGLFEKACEENYPIGCMSLGRMLVDGVGMEKDVRRARILFYKACTLGDTKGCEWSAYLHLTGPKRSRNLSLARRLYAKVCGWDNPEACHNLAYMKFKGWGGRRDLNGAVASFTKLCKNGFLPSCAALKHMVSKWMITGAKRQEIMELVGSKCSKGNCGTMSVVAPRNK